MKVKENLLGCLNKSQTDFIQSLNDFFSGFVFIVNPKVNIFQLVDYQKAIAYGFKNNVFAFDEFLNTYLNPIESGRLKLAFAKLVKHQISAYSSIFSIINPETKKSRFFYLTIKMIELIEIQQDKLFVGVAQDIRKLDLTKLQFNKLVEELDFFNNNKEKFNLLTQREKEILSFICECKTNLEISQELFISQSTVETHRKRIIKKLSARNSLDLINYARVFETHVFQDL